MSVPAAPDLALTDLFTPGRAGQTQPAYITGVLLTWDPVTYANTVAVGGRVTYTNLAAVNPAALPTDGSQVAVALARTDGAPLLLGPIVRFAPAPLEA